MSQVVQAARAAIARIGGRVLSGYAREQALALPALPEGRVVRAPSGDPRVPPSEGATLALSVLWGRCDASDEVQGWPEWPEGTSAFYKDNTRWWFTLIDLARGEDGGELGAILAPRLGDLS